MAELSTLIEDLLAEANRDLTHAVGDSSLCAVSKTGGRVDAVKYLEGRTSALREVRREGPDALTRVESEWRSQLDRVLETEMGPDWLAYRAGGADVLAELLSNLS